jgi:hypothetical protein
MKVSDIEVDSFAKGRKRNLHGWLALWLIFEASEAKFPPLPVAGEPNEEVPFFFSTMTFASLRLGWPTNRLENTFVLDFAQVGMFPNQGIETFGWYLIVA